MVTRMAHLAAMKTAAGYYYSCRCAPRRAESPRLRGAQPTFVGL